MDDYIDIGPVRAKTMPQGSERFALSAGGVRYENRSGQRLLSQWRNCEGGVELTYQCIDPETGDEVFKHRHMIYFDELLVEHARATFGQLAAHDLEDNLHA